MASPCPLQHCKYLEVIRPVAIVDAASWTTVAIDTAGFDWVTIIFQYGTSDIAMAALKVQESKNSDGNPDAYADITGTVVGTAVDITGTTSALPSASDDGQLVVWHINTRGRERYFDLVATAGDGSTGSFASALAILSQGDHSIDTATLSGVSHEFVVA